MIQGKIKNLIPDEWTSVVLSYADMARNALTTGHAVIKIAISNLAPILLGVIICYPIPRFVLNETATQSILAVCGILAGFAVSQMFLTGKLPDLEDVTVQDARHYADKVRYLFFSQTSTLAAYIATVLACVVYLSVGASSNAYAHECSSLVAGLSTWSLSRTLLMPGQIYEVQSYLLQIECDAKTEKQSRKLREDQKRIFSS